MAGDGRSILPADLGTCLVASQTIIIVYLCGRKGLHVAKQQQQGTGGTGNESKVEKRIAKDKSQS